MPDRRMNDEDLHYLERNFWFVIGCVVAAIAVGFVFGEVFIWG